MRFSIIIPAYNAEKFICRSVNSVLAQTFDDFEIIVIDDGSKDGTLENLRKIKDSRLVVITKQNEGVSVARNTGILKAQGEYICFLDADDEYFPNHLEHFNKLIDEYRGETFFVTRFCYSEIDDYGKVHIPTVSGEISVYRNVVEQILKAPELVWTGCVCIKHEMFQKYGMFEPGVKLGEDTDMWRRIYLHTGIVYSDSVTVKRNRDGSEATKQYTRSFEVDPLNRIPMYLADNTIADDVKTDLKKEYEFTKLSVVRSYLYVGDKKSAIKLIEDIDKRVIPCKRWMITKLCFYIPSVLIRTVFKLKNRGMYQ